MDRIESYRINRTRDIASDFALILELRTMASLDGFNILMKQKGIEISIVFVTHYVMIHDC